MEDILLIFKNLIAVDDSKLNVTRSCPNFVQKVIHSLFESVRKFENQSVLMRAWQNKIVSSILNFKQCNCLVSREGTCLYVILLNLLFVSLQVRLHGVTVIHSPGVSFSFLSVTMAVANQKAHATLLPLTYKFISLRLYIS